MASAYETLDVGQLIQIGVVEEHEEAVPTCSTTNEGHYMRWTDECVKLFITHNTRILFHKAHLYKSIRCIFTCEKSLYSQSELRTAISHVKV